jgi:hypothetical protein
VAVVLVVVFPLPELLLEKLAAVAAAVVVVEFLLVKFY